MPISKKFRSLDEEHNKEVYEKVVTNSSKIYEEYFNMNFSSLFKIYYNNCKPLNKILIRDEIITLSEKTKSFYDLIKKNDSIKSELIEFTKKVYLIEEDQGKNSGLKPIFLTSKNY